MSDPDSKTVDSLVNELTLFLNREVPEMGPYISTPLKRYYRIACMNGNAAYCFVVREGFSQRSLGIVHTGDFLYPATWSRPAKHARGNLFEREEWPAVFTKNGIRSLK